MPQSLVHRVFAPIRRLSPVWLSNFLRSLATAFLTPIRFSWRSGHFRSSFRMASVTRRGTPLPWYTYPAIDFLEPRSFAGKNVLEFGGGQSTFWWAERAKHVLTMEESEPWYHQLKPRVPTCVDMHLITMASAEACVTEVEAVLARQTVKKFDVIVIDGLFRYEIAAIAPNYLADDGIIICDDSEGFSFREALLPSGLQRVDFFGYQPGVVLPHCTSIYFRHSSFVFHGENPIPVIADA